MMAEPGQELHVEIVSRSLSGTTTGIGRYTNELSRHLKDRIDLRIVSEKSPPLVSQLSFLHQLPIGIKDHQPGSIVHFTQIIGCSIMLLRHYQLSVATVHDLGVLELPEEWKMFDPIGRLILRISLDGLRRVTKILAVSEFTRKGIIKYLGIDPDKVSTVYHGIDHDIFKPQINGYHILINRFSRLANLSRPWLLYVGSELPRKNLLTLLNVVARLKKTYPGVHLIKVGSSGGQRFRDSTMCAIAELGLQETVLFFDNVSDQILALLYSTADIYVTTSKLEGFGWPVLEAMASGTPVVCSNAGSLPEIIGGAGYMVDPIDIDSFASIISSVLDDTMQQKEMSVKGLAQAANFTWENSTEKIIEVYRSIIE